MKKRVTIKDIALASGYSVNCISRALMDASDISQKTKEIVRELALEMGYIPNSAATTLRKGSSKTIGILYDSLLNPFYSIMTNYLWNDLGESGYSFVTIINDKPFLDEDIARRALSGSVDGLISFLEPTEGGLKLCKEHGVPVVIVGRKSNFDVQCVILDDVGGGRVAADYLFNKGYRHPMYLGESTALACSKERADGFVQRFAELGVTAETHFNNDFRKLAYKEFFEDILARPTEQRPDCVFVFNDFFALEVLTYMREAKINFAVVGFDDIQNEIAMNGRISSVGYSKQSFATLVVEKLLNLIADGNAKKDITVLQNVYIVDGETA